MERIPQVVLEHLFGKMIEERPLEIVGFKKPISFEIYDGYAYCPDYYGNEYAIEFPLTSLVEKSTELQSDIRDWMNLEETAKITIYDIIQTFNVMFRNGVKVAFDEKKNKWFNA